MLPFEQDNCGIYFDDEHFFSFRNFNLNLDENEDEYSNKNFYPPLSYDGYPSFNLDFNPAPLFEKTEKEKVNIIIDSKQKTDNSSKKVVRIPDTVANGETKEKKFLGRKTKGDNEERKHDKYTEDNKLRKIKSNFVNTFPDYVNSSLPPEHRKFLRISKKVNEELNIEYNRKLMNKTLGEIFSQNPINGRYSKKNYQEDYNRKLVEEIYRKNEETEAIEKLNQTYLQVLDNFRKNNLEQFKDDILKKETKNFGDRKSAMKYIDELVELLFNYERWFNDKVPRSRKNKN